MRDIYESVTSQILTAMERALKCEQRWTVNANGLARPTNIRGKAYRGINVPLLWLAAQDKGYTSSQWGTFKAWQEKGGCVRKGERGTAIVFWKQLTRKDPETGEDEEFAMARGYYVFNRAQVDGLPEESTAAGEALPEPERNAAVESFLAATGAKFIFGGARAFYRRDTDTIHLPPLRMFRDAEGFYATAGHELVHWSGAPNRLNREKGKRFGDEQYAFEELIAEMGAAFLCADLGLSAEPRDDHADYLKSWIKVLRNDKRAIFSAASKAEKACDYLHALQRTDDGPDKGPSTPAVIVAPIALPAPAPLPVVVEPIAASVPVPVVEPIAASVIVRGGLRSYKRSEKWIGDYCVRRVPCFSRNAPTVHAIIHAGRWINSFLSADLALAWARKMARSDRKAA